MPSKIGIVSSTPLQPEFRAAFVQGMNDAGKIENTDYTIDVQDAGGMYDAAGAQDVHDQLFSIIKQFDKAGSQIDVIVSVGGLVSAHVAFKKVSRKRFLVLVGGNVGNNDFMLNQTQNLHYCGGVTLGSDTSNEERASALTIAFHNIAPRDVALIFNPNSRTGRKELKSWKTINSNRKFAPAGIDDVEGENTPLAEVFTAGFDKVLRAPNPAAAVVISADPFFASQKDFLVEAANASNLKICYPFEFYGKATHGPDPLRSIWYGPDLVGAYRDLGAKAGGLLSDTSSPFPDQGTDPAPITVTTQNPGTFHRILEEIDE